MTDRKPSPRRRHAKVVHPSPLGIKILDWVLWLMSSKAMREHGDIVQKSAFSVVLSAILPGVLVAMACLILNVVALSGHAYPDHVPDWFIYTFVIVALLLLAVHITFIALPTDQGGDWDAGVVYPARPVLCWCCIVLLTLADAPAFGLVQFVLAKLLF